MWEARATYEDGTEVCEYFYQDRKLSEDEQQYFLEGWLIEQHEGCTWYSVNWVNE